jgi:hypothetical protein
MGTIRVKPVQNNNSYSNAYGKWYMTPHLNATLA